MPRAARINFRRKPRKPYIRKACPRSPGRRSWLESLEPGELAALVERLDQQPTLVTIGRLRLLLRLSWPVFIRFMGRAAICPVEGPTRYHPDRGHERVASRREWYDPADVIAVLRRRLHQLGDDRSGSPLSGPEYREVPSVDPARFVRRTGLRDRWTPADLGERRAAALDLGQWLTTRETAAWLGVTLQTLYLWRREGTGPPYHQGNDLVPSFARSLARSPRFGTRHGRVLYDRNEVLAWLRGPQ